MAMSMVNESVVKQERSLAVYGRVDVVSLAEVMTGLVKMGHNTRTMSSLVSYCVEIAHAALEQNGYIDRKVSGITEAYYLMVDRGLMSPSMQKKNMPKFNMASGFENLRKEGIDPEVYTAGSGAYKQLHNTHSVEPVNPLLTKSKAQEMVDNYERYERQRMIDEDKARNEEARANREYNEDGSVKILPAYQFRETPAITAEPAKLGRPLKNPTTNPPVECVQVERLLAPNELRDKLNAMTHEERRAYVESLKPKKKVKDSDIPRAMTEDELRDTAVRLENKERDLMAALDANILPKPRTSECQLDPDVTNQ